MLLTALYLLASLAAVVAAFAGIIYPFKCRALERHLDSTPPDYAEDEAGHSAWYKKQLRLDNGRTRTALYALGAYMVGLFSLIPIMSLLKTAGITSHAPTILVIIITGAIWIVVGRSAIHTSRKSDLDNKRRYPYGRQ
jgi:hypothetical protein